MLRFDLRRAARTFTMSVFATLTLLTAQVAVGGLPSPAPDQSTLVGVFQGDVQGQANLCPDPGDNELFSAAMLITLDSVSNNHAVGGFVTGDGDTGSIRLQINALNNVMGIASGRSPDGSTFDLSLSGSFNPETGKLSLSFSGTDSLGCSLSGNVMVTRIFLAFLFDPLNSAPSVLLNSEGARHGAIKGQRISGTARSRRQANGGGEGIMRYGDGVMVQGRAAGSGMPIGAWAGVSRTSTEDDFATTAFKETRYDFLGGLDTLLDDGTTLVGVALGIETADTKTQFNGGRQNLTAITVAPYVAMLLTDWLSFDASVGYSDVQIDQSRVSPGSGATITSDVEGMRLFGSFNLAATYQMDNLLLTGLGGMSWATQRNDSFRESGGLLVGKQSSDLGRFLLGGEAAYTLGHWEPYARAMFEYDFTKTRINFAPGVVAPKKDDTDVLVGLGVRYFGNNGVSGALEYSTLLGRSNLDEDTLSANVRWEF